MSALLAHASQLVEGGLVKIVLEAVAEHALLASYLVEGGLVKIILEIESSSAQKPAAWKVGL